MNSQTTRKVIGDSFNYKLLKSEFDDFELLTYRNKLLQKFSILTKNWTNELHSEWTARMFLAAKMICASTLLLNTLNYSKRKNIRLTEPYLLYYSIFNCCRTLTFTHPLQIWRNGELISDSHARVIKNTGSILDQINKDKSKDLLALIKITKDYRELFSYKYPADGLRNETIFRDVNLENITKKCRLLCEIAQFTSECFETSYEKHCSTNDYSLTEDNLEICLSYQGDNYSLTDDEDTYRISYIMRKVKRPYNIYFTMTEGMIDDFFGSWLASDEDDVDSFDPDERLINIFELP